MAKATKRKMSEEEARWAAEDAAMLAQAKARDEYNRLEDIFSNVRDASGRTVYLFDPCVDRENASDPNCWISLLSSARCAVAERCSEAGIDAKALCGYDLA